MLYDAQIKDREVRIGQAKERLSTVMNDSILEND